MTAHRQTTHRQTTHRPRQLVDRRVVGDEMSGFSLSTSCRSTKSRSMSFRSIGCHRTVYSTGRGLSVTKKKVFITLTAGQKSFPGKYHPSFVAKGSDCLNISGWVNIPYMYINNKGRIYVINNLMLMKKPQFWGYSHFWKFWNLKPTLLVTKDKFDKKN